MTLDQILQLDEELTHAKETAQLAASRPAVLSQVSEAELEVQRLKTLVDAYTAAAHSATKSVQEHFMEAASQFVGPNEAVVLDVTGKQVVFGLSVDGELREGGSGSEGLRLMVATLGALPPKEAGRALVLTIPDRMWDPEHLAEFMEACADVPHQIILQSTVKYKGRKPKGWSILELDADGEVVKGPGSSKKTQKSKKSKKSKASKAPPVPANAPAWLQNAMKQEAVQVKTVQHYLETERPDHEPLTLTEITHADKHVIPGGIFHSYPRLKAVSFTPADPRDTRWVWSTS